MYPEEYEAEMLKQKILEEHPELEQQLEVMINLYMEHASNQEDRNNGNC